MEVQCEWGINSTMADILTLMDQLHVAAFDSGPETMSEQLRPKSPQSCSSRMKPSSVWPLTPKPSLICRPCKLTHSLLCGLSVANMGVFLLDQGLCEEKCHVSKVTGWIRLRRHIVSYGWGLFPWSNKCQFSFF